MFQIDQKPMNYDACLLNVQEIESEHSEIIPLAFEEPIGALSTFYDESVDVGCFPARRENGKPIPTIKDLPGMMLLFELINFCNLTLAILIIDRR